MEALLVVLAVFGILVVILVAGAGTPLTKYLLPKRVDEAMRKVVRGARLDDARVDVRDGRYQITLPGARGLTEIRVAQRGAMTVSVAYRPGVRFPRRGSFAFRSSERDLPDDPRSNPQEQHARMQELIETALAPKGFVPATGDTEPTLLVLYGVAFEGPVTGPELDRLHGYASKDEGSHAADAPTSAKQVYEKGSLVIDILAAAGELLIWRAAAMAHIVVDVSVEEKVARTRAAIDTMFEELPPKSSSQPAV